MKKIKDKNKKIDINPGTNLIAKKESGLFDYSFSINVSVRQLVEFVLRSGDIDNRHSTSVDNAMQEGGRLHRMIQKKMGENYYSEVLLKYSYQTERFAINIEGRADGIILEEYEEDILEKLNITENEIMLNQHLLNEDFMMATIDEIKCVARSLDKINEPVSVHLAQAKVYAYIYAKQNKLPLIRVRMSYCQMETTQMKYFDYEYSFAEINEWFENLMGEYIKWADFQYDWYYIRQNSIKQTDFPYTYREGQKQLAVYVYQTIKESKKLYLEAPTGVGKTISTIFPSIKAMGERLVEKIFYLTAKTITRTVAEDTFDLLRKGGLKIKTVTITAKEKICIYEKAECNPFACERAGGHFDRVNEAIFYAISHYDRIDRNVIEETAEAYNVCPFELGLDISLFADAIICDYNYVFDPHASLKRYFSDGMKGNYTFLIDEAHNLVERGRGMFSASLLKEDLLKLKKIITIGLEKQTLEKTFNKPSLALRLSKALERCNKEMLAMRKACDGCIILDDIDRFAGLVESLHTVMDQFLEEENDGQIRKEVLEYYFEICHFLMIYEKLDEDYIIYAQLSDNGSFMLKLFCVNPRNNLKAAMAKARSSILFSATLLPIQYYKKLLGGDETDYEVYAKSTFDNNKRALLIGNDVTSKYTRRNELEFNKIASYIYQVTKAKKGNYMVFFPSHAFLQNVYRQFVDSFFEESLMNLVVQEEYMDENMREQFITLFEETENLDENKSLIGFCVLGGIFSEGIDLKKDSLIGTIIVGTGIPMVCNEREILKDYFDDEEGTGFDYAYRYPGMNKVLQAAGRVIRTAEDAGVVLLLDERFLNRQTTKLFPREWDGIKVVSNKTVKNEIETFWNGISNNEK